MSKEFQIRDGNLIASFDLENEDGDINFCKLLKVSHGVADEIGMFVDYVATNKIIKGQSKQISDLEAKLAEQTECSLKASAKHNLEMQNAQICIKELEAKLAEKDKKKESFKVMYFNKCLDFEHLYEKFNDKCAEFELKEYDYKQTIFEKDQDKISFCIEQLEQIINLFEPYENDEKDTILCSNNGISFLEYIDNQIKQLKEMK